MVQHAVARRQFHDLACILDALELEVIDYVPDLSIYTLDVQPLDPSD